MAALNSIGMPVATAPPDVPSTIPGEVAGYLRKLSVWMTGQLNSKIPQQTAVPQIMLLSPGGITYALRAQDNGNISIIRIPPGSTPT